MPELKVSNEELQALLVEELGVIEQADFNRASALAQRLRTPLIHTLVEQGRIPQAFLLDQLARSWNVRFVDLTIGHVKGDVIGTIQEAFSRKHILLPFDRDGDQLHVAMADPRERKVVSEIEHTTGLRVSPFLATEASIRRAQLLYKKELREILDRATTNITTELTSAKQHDGSESTIVDAVQRLLLYAAVTRASDIHIEPFELETVVRYRVDGVMREVFSLTPALQLPLVSRIKILSGMRIDERRTRRTVDSKPTSTVLKWISGSRQFPHSGEKKSSSESCQRTMSSSTWRIWDSCPMIIRLFSEIS